MSDPALSDWNTARSLAGDLLSAHRNNVSYNTISDKWPAVTFPDEDALDDEVTRIIENGYGSDERVNELARWLIQQDLPTSDSEHTQDTNLSEWNETRSIAATLRDVAEDDELHLGGVLTEVGADETEELETVVTNPDGDVSIEQYNSIARWLSNHPGVLADLRVADIRNVASDPVVGEQDDTDNQTLSIPERPDDIDVTAAEWEEACRVAAETRESFTERQGRYGDIIAKTDLSMPSWNAMFSIVRDGPDDEQEMIEYIAVAIVTDYTPKNTPQPMGYRRS